MLNLLSETEIKKNLIIDTRVITVKETESTNDDLKGLAANGAAEWTVLCADMQTKGRGRTGNSFFSPESGIYMSVLLRPDFSPDNSLFITTLAACSVCRAIEKLTEKKIKIKWVNDIYNENGKICGILSEASVNYEENKINYAILGIGLNLLPPNLGFPEELQGKAAALFCDNDSVPEIRNHLIAEIINQFYVLYNNFDKYAHIKEYRQRSMLIGKEISYLFNGAEFFGSVIDFDDECRLVVRNDSGEIIKLSSGEVKIKQW